MKNSQDLDFNLWFSDELDFGGYSRLLMFTTRWNQIFYLCLKSTKIKINWLTSFQKISCAAVYFLQPILVLFVHLFPLNHWNRISEHPGETQEPNMDTLQLLQNSTKFFSIFILSKCGWRTAEYGQYSFSRRGPPLFTNSLKSFIIIFPPAQKSS